ncbi:PAS domain-containing hybrid sensor histidine kinase/response regulator [Reinekea sp. G2M2-21]|uniref:PAS domain-containing hybrid sensor histidine kinase/response regulator n=1 Tax=Reinekea sp. G2M2-21 TaxID=2788942 RepID=UPI0018A9FBCF|nr:PAS domain-containing hybrid sensor histidine kinase/response regulator [Reinekea sp. G2M2-21]
MEWLLTFALAIALSGWLLSASELRRARQLNAASEARLDLLHKAISAAHAGVFNYKVATNKSFWDEKSLAMFGLEGKARYILPGTWESMLHPEDREGALSNITQVLSGQGNLFNHTYRIILPDNSVRWIEGTGFVIRDKQGNPLEVTGFHFDVTQQAEYEQTLRASESKALRAMEAKTQFLANMSHEIRTPMNAIVGMIELLNLEKPTTIQQRYLHTLQNSSDVLLRIINDILDVSKIEAGKLALESTEFNIREVILQCLAVYTQASDRSNVLLTGWVDPAIPTVIRGDSTRLQQVLMNLIGNAFKFTEQGHITLRVRFDVSALRFEIADTGIGIPSDKQTHLFERFHQADTSTTRKFGGTGLGLAIVKEIIQLWGGGIQVDSTPGQGTTLQFTLPCLLPARETAPHSGRYLLCTRHSELADLWRQDDRAPQMTWVKNKAEFEASLARATFTHLIVEQRFPQTSGMALIQQTKQQVPELQGILIGFEKYVKDLEDTTAIDRFLARPFVVNQLWDPEFVRLESAPVDSAKEYQPDYSYLSVLCVDDNQSNLIVLAGLLKRFQIKAECVSNGADAIKRVMAQPYDLVLMDYEMPDMDGPEATEHIVAIRPTNVVGLSAHTGDYFQQQATASGMQAFLTKPIRLKALASLLADYAKPNATESESNRLNSEY